MMDMMCVRVQDHLNSLRFSETSLVQEDMKVAENLMKDAKNSKTVRSLTLISVACHATFGGLGHKNTWNLFPIFSMISEHHSSLQLLPNLYHLRSGGSKGACVGAIQDKLESMAGEVARVMDEQLQVLSWVQQLLSLP